MVLSFFLSCTVNINHMTCSFSRFIAQKIHLQRKIADVSIFCNSATHTVSSSQWVKKLHEDFSCNLLYIIGIIFIKYIFQTGHSIIALSIWICTWLYIFSSFLKKNTSGGLIMYLGEFDFSTNVYVVKITST